MLSQPNHEDTNLRFGDTEVFLKHDGSALFFGQDRETDQSV
jgi:hypothetical protein